MISEETGRIPVDVICQFNSDGRIIPLRLRLKADDGEFHAYTINEYRDLSHRGRFVSPDGMEPRADVYEFDCEITVFRRKRHVRLFYKSSSYASEWSVCL